MGDAELFEVITAVHDGPIPREARPTDAIIALDRIAKSAAFDVITAVKDVPIPREARPTDAIEVLAAPSEAIVEHAGTPKVMTAIEDSALAPVVVDTAGEITVDTSHRDEIAKQRGLPPIAEPYVRDHAPMSRRWLYASVCISVASVIVAASVVVWARGEVDRARQAQAEKAQPLVAMRTVEARNEVSDTPPVAATPTSVPAAIAPQREPSTCSLRVGANARGATVWIDGTSHGAAPAEMPIECRREITVEVRHPRYEDFKRTLSVDGGVLAVDARLERDKTELTVTSEPAGATVTYNGRALGKTPLVTKVNRYEQGTLRLRAPGRAADWRKIVPKEPAKTVSVTLKPAS